MSGYTSWVGESGSNTWAVDREHKPRQRGLFGWCRSCNKVLYSDDEKNGGECSYCTAARIDAQNDAVRDITWYLEDHPDLPFLDLATESELPF